MPNVTSSGNAAAGQTNLSANENPLGPSPRALEAITTRVGGVNRYPDNEGADLKAVLAEALGVRPENIVLGNGSCEVLDLAARACLLPADEAIMGFPAFLPYQSVVRRAHGIAVIIPLQDFSYDLEGMARRITDRTRLILIGNPNNPTGTTLGRNELERFLEKVPPHVLVILDEAYREYVGREDFPASLDYVAEGRHVLVLRSLSKAYALAGLRIGYGIAAPPLIHRLDGVRQHYNTNSLAQIAAAAAIGDREHLRRSIENNAAGMRYLEDEFDAMRLGHVPSEANFILVKVGDGAQTHRRLKEDGILVMAMDHFQLPEYIRVSIGTPEENERFIRALGSIIREIRA